MPKFIEVTMYNGSETDKNISKIDMRKHSSRALLNVSQINYILENVDGGATIGINTNKSVIPIWVLDSYVNVVASLRKKGE